MPGSHFGEFHKSALAADADEAVPDAEDLLTEDVGPVHAGVPQVRHPAEDRRENVNEPVAVLELLTELPVQRRLSSEDIRQLSSREVTAGAELEGVGADSHRAQVLRNAVGDRPQNGVAGDLDRLRQVGHYRPIVERRVSPLHYIYTPSPYVKYQVPMGMLSLRTADEGRFADDDPSLAGKQQTDQACSENERRLGHAASPP